MTSQSSEGYPFPFHNFTVMHFISLEWLKLSQQQNSK